MGKIEIHFYTIPFNSTGRGKINSIHKDHSKLGENVEKLLQQNSTSSQTQEKLIVIPTISKKQRDHRKRELLVMYQGVIVTASYEL